MNERRWYVFEVMRPAYDHHPKVIGRCETTLTAIRERFPHATVAGNLVTIRHRSR